MRSPPLVAGAGLIEELTDGRVVASGLFGEAGKLGFGFVVKDKVYLAEALFSLSSVILLHSISRHITHSCTLTRLYKRSIVVLCLYKQ